MTEKGVGFSNVFIGNDEAAVHAWNREHFIPKHRLQDTDWRKAVPPIVETTGNGLIESLKDFGTALSEVARDLYNENAVGAIVVGALIVIVPLVIVVYVCICPVKEEKGSSDPKKTESEKEKHE
jgi:calnexin